MYQPDWLLDGSTAICCVSNLRISQAKKSNMRHCHHATCHSTGHTLALRVPSKVDINVVTPVCWFRSFLPGFLKGVARFGSCQGSICLVWLRPAGCSTFCLKRFSFLKLSVDDIRKINLQFCKGLVIVLMCSPIFKVVSIDFGGMASQPKFHDATAVLVVDDAAFSASSFLECLSACSCITIFTLTGTWDKRSPCRKEENSHFRWWGLIVVQYSAQVCVSCVHDFDSIFKNVQGLLATGRPEPLALLWRLSGRSSPPCSCGTVCVQYQYHIVDDRCGLLRPVDCGALAINSRGWRSTMESFTSSLQ